MGKIKLTRQQKNGVREWLDIFDEGKESRCPFEYLMDYHKSEEKHHNICRSWFPKCRTRICEIICPCNCYALSHVIKIAKQMLEY